MFTKNTVTGIRIFPVLNSYVLLLLKMKENYRRYIDFILLGCILKYWSFRIMQFEYWFKMHYIDRQRPLYINEGNKSKRNFLRNIEFCWRYHEMRKFMNEYKVLKSFLERSLLCPVESENYQNSFISFLFYELKLEWWICLLCFEVFIYK